MLNKLTIIGHLGADPEARYTASGSMVTTFRVATSNSFKGSDGERKEHTEWHRVVCWNRLAEICAQHLTKGRLVYVEGRLQTRSWENQQGQKQYTTELIAQEVKFLGGRAGGDPDGLPSRDVSDDLDPDQLPF